jgi:hypothetical protein
VRQERRANNRQLHTRTATELLPTSSYQVPDCRQNKQQEPTTKDTNNEPQPWHINIPSRIRNQTSNDIGTRRLTRELLALRRDPIKSPRILTSPLETNILEWRYVVEGSLRKPLTRVAIYHGQTPIPEGLSAQTTVCDYVYTIGTLCHRSSACV